MSRQQAAAGKYARFFSQQGLDIDRLDRVRFASAVTSSPIRFALIAALDDWAFVAYLIANRNRGPKLARLLELARAADPEPWRDRFRDPAVWADREALTRLADEDDVGMQSPTVLAPLGALLRLNGADPTALFERALLDHPQDFWLHLHAAMFTNTCTQCCCPIRRIETRRFPRLQG
jgi:hypothetical protein